MKELNIKIGVSKTLLILGSCLLNLSIHAQTPKAENIARAGLDSNVVQGLFFSALGQKAIDNDTQAADLFGKVIAIDPSNDASLYELAHQKETK